MPAFPFLTFASRFTFFSCSGFNLFREFMESRHGSEDVMIPVVYEARRGMEEAWRYGAATTSPAIVEAGQQVTRANRHVS